MSKIRERFVCARCTSTNGRWARKIESGRWVCAKCYNDLPYKRGTNKIADDMRTDVNPRRKWGKTVWTEVDTVGGVLND